MKLAIPLLGLNFKLSQIMFMTGKPLSVIIEMQKAMVADQAVINDVNAENVTYVDAGQEEVNKEEERIVLMLQDCKTLDEVNALQEQCPDLDVKYFNARKEELGYES